MSGDSYYPNVSLLLPMSGANNGTVFTDYSPVVKAVTVLGGAKTVTTQSQFYGSSGVFDGSGDSLSASSSDFALGTGDFTIECWVYPVTGGGGSPYARLVEIGNNSTSGGLWIVRTGSADPLTLLIQVFSGTYITIFASTTTLANLTWTHMALTRASGVWKLWIGGVNTNTVTYTGAGNNITQQTLFVGGNNSNAENYNGNLQDLRITKGIARYTSNFTPPTKFMGSISGTIYDNTNTPCARSIVAFPRSYPAKVVTATSNGTTGGYTLSDLPITEYNRIAQDNGVLYNDIIDRVVPG